MKKIYFALFAILIFPFIISFNAFAYDYVDSTDIANKLNSYFNVNLSYNSEFITYVNNNFSYNGAIVIDYSSGSNLITVYKKADTNPSIYSDRIVFYDYIYFYNTGGNGYSYSSSTFYFNNANVLYFVNGEEMYNFFHVSIDFDNIYYSANIPTPNMDVYYVLSSNSGGSGIAVWNAEMTIEDNSQFYIQYGYKITVPTYVGVGLDSSTGQYTYSYEQYSEGNYVDFVSLQDLQQCVNISFGSNEMSSAWQDAYNLLVESIPEFYAKIPFWVQNPNAAKYVDAQNYYKNYMMTQLPMFGNRLELFARYFVINEDNQVVVGDWLHWSSRTGSRTQEKPSNYIDNVQLPGFVNTSNNVTLETEDNTFQQSGESVGAATVINNNYAPNYPDYPTIASYNKDNLLLETMGYMSNMNNFLSGPQGFGHFLTEVFTFIPSYVWGMVAMGFGVAIIVMFIKML